MLTPSADGAYFEFVLEELLEDLAEPGLVTDRGERHGRALPTDRAGAQQQPQRLDGLVDRPDGVERGARQPGQALATDRGEDRIDEAIEAAELFRRGRVPVLVLVAGPPPVAAASASRST